jgi:hypothetical protein
MQLMRTLLRRLLFLIIGVLCGESGLPLRAADPIGGNWGACIYSNSLNDLVIRFDPKTREVGDQIVLAGTERYLTYFDFEYWGANSANLYSFAGDVQARLRFYLNDGTPFNGYATPSTVLYDSGWFGGFGPTDYYPYRATIYFTAGSDFGAEGLFIPADEITWSVQFQGMGLTDTVGVDLYSPPVVGQDYPDYWENNGGWTLLTNTVPMDFGARMYAVETPEPSTFVLSLAGGLGILTLVRRLRRAN